MLGMPLIGTYDVDMTQAGLAEKVSPQTTKQHIWNWEHGKIPERDKRAADCGRGWGAPRRTSDTAWRGVQENGEAVDVGRGAGAKDGR